MRIDFLDNLPDTNRRPPFGFVGFGCFGRWIGCQRPFPGWAVS